MVVKLGGSVRLAYSLREPLDRTFVQGNRWPNRRGAFKDLKVIIQTALDYSGDSMACMIEEEKAPILRTVIEKRINLKTDVTVVSKEKGEFIERNRES